MKKRHIVGLFFLLMASCVSLRTISGALFTLHNLAFCIDDHIAPEEKHAIMHYIQTMHNQNGTFTTQHIIPIRQQFPFIESIAITLLPGNIAQYTIRAAKPCCLINQELVFTENNRLVHKQAFTQASIENLAALCVDKVALQKENGLHGLQECICALPSNLFTGYNVTWINPTQIRLQDKKETEFAIIFSTDRIPDARILTACTTIKQNLPVKKNRIERKKMVNVSTWAADIRFNNQIVLYTETGGCSHG